MNKIMKVFAHFGTANIGTTPLVVAFGVLAFIVPLISATATWQSNYGAIPLYGIEFATRCMYCAVMIIITDIVPAMFGVTIFMYAIDYVQNRGKGLEIKGNNVWSCLFFLIAYFALLYWNARMCAAAGDLEGIKIASKIEAMETKPQNAALELTKQANAIKADKAVEVEKVKVPQNIAWGASHGNLEMEKEVKRLEKSAMAKAEQKAIDAANVLKVKTLDAAKTVAETEAIDARVGQEKQAKLLELYGKQAAKSEADYFFISIATSVLLVIAQFGLAMIAISLGLHKVKDFRMLHLDIFKFGATEEEEENDTQQISTGGQTIQTTQTGGGNLTRDLTAETLQRSRAVPVREISSGGSSQRAGLVIDESTNVAEIVQYYLDTKGNVTAAKIACASLRDMTKSRHIEPLKEAISRHIVSSMPQDAIEDDIRAFDILNERLDKFNIKWHKLNEALGQFPALRP